MEIHDKENDLLVIYEWLTNKKQKQAKKKESTTMELCIMGAIGVGKSTLAKVIANKVGGIYVEESVKGNLFLKSFYKDKPTFAFWSQLEIGSKLFLSWWKVKNEEVKRKWWRPNKKNKENGIIFDSSLISNLVFNKLLKTQGYITNDEDKIIKRAAEHHIKTLGHPDKYIVLLKDKEVCMKNVKTRDRSMEQEQEDYLHFHYDNYERICKELFEYYKVPEDKILWLRVKNDDLYKEGVLDKLLDDIRKSKESQQ